PGFGVLLDEPGERWAAVARDRLGVARQGEADGLLGQEHRHLLAPLDRCAANEEGDGYPLGVLKSSCEVDHHLGRVWHLRSLFAVTAGTIRWGHRFGVAETSH